MKRRNVDNSKTRRPVKKIPKIYDGFYTGLVVYVKLILLWICVMGGDFLLEFRLEYLYPIYLVLHNTYEAYKFQGVAFALLLGCVVVSVDVICLGVIPVQWLFLIGSLAVWSHISWSLAPLGPLILLPTLIYIDGKSIRPLPTQSLSPLAAHCVGFPLVSLGFGLKAFIASRLKQRTRNDVARQNDVLYSLLWDALPFTPSSSPINNNEVIPNGGTGIGGKKGLGLTMRRKSIELLEEIPGKSLSGSPSSLNNNSSTSASHHSPLSNGGLSSPLSSSSPPILNGSANHVFLTQNNNLSCTNFTNSNNNNNHNSAASGTLSSQTSLGMSSQSPVAAILSPPGTLIPNQCSCMLAPKNFKLESEVRKLRSDLHVVRTTESELRNQISTLLGLERNLRADIAALQGEHESLQLKYSAFSSKSQEERQCYEKKLIEERKAKENAINKQKKASLECCGDCKRKLRDAEREKETLRRDLKLGEEKIVRIERELQNVKSTLLHEQKNKETSQQPSAESTRVMSLLTALQDQNAHLESSLSAETRLKLDLFSALGEARRQLSIRDSMIKAKEEELEEVRGQLIEILTVSDFSNPNRQAQNQSPILQINQQHQQQQQQQHQPNHFSLQPQHRLNNLKQNHSQGQGLHGVIGSIPLGVSVSCHGNHHNGPTSPLLQSQSPSGGLGGLTPQQQQQQQQQLQHSHGSGGGHSHMHPGNENLNFSSLIES